MSVVLLQVGREEQQLAGTLQHQKRLALSRFGAAGLRGNVDACAGRRECAGKGSYIQQAVVAKHEGHSIKKYRTGLDFSRCRRRVAPKKAGWRSVRLARDKEDRVLTRSKHAKGSNKKETNSQENHIHPAKSYGHEIPS